MAQTSCYVHANGRLGKDPNILNNGLGSDVQIIIEFSSSNFFPFTFTIKFSKFSLREEIETEELKWVVIFFLPKRE